MPKPQRRRPSPPLATDWDPFRSGSRLDPYWGASPVGTDHSGNRRHPRSRSGHSCRHCRRRRNCCCRSRSRRRCRCSSPRLRRSRARWGTRRCPRSTFRRMDRHCRTFRNGNCCSTYRRRRRHNRSAPPRSHRHRRRKHHRCKLRWHRAADNLRSVRDRRRGRGSRRQHRNTPHRRGSSPARRRRSGTRRERGHSGKPRHTPHSCSDRTADRRRRLRSRLAPPHRSRRRLARPKLLPGGCRLRSSRPGGRAPAGVRCTWQRRGSERRTDGPRLVLPCSDGKQTDRRHPSLAMRGHVTTPARGDWSADRTLSPREDNVKTRGQSSAGRTIPVSRSISRSSSWISPLTTIPLAR
jgi:hypothetical protein